MSASVGKCKMLCVYTCLELRTYMQGGQAFLSPKRFVQTGIVCCMWICVIQGPRSSRKRVMVVRDHAHALVCKFREVPYFVKVYLASL